MNRLDCRRCNYQAEDREQLAEHAGEAGHTLCRICSRSLTEYEPTVCGHCQSLTRDRLDEIVTAYALIPVNLEAAGYRSLVDVDALAMWADGSIEGGGPDEWLTDPTPVIAVLESCEREWRHEFGHGPAESIATVTGCTGYLMTHLSLAGRTHPCFDDFVREIRDLHRLIGSKVGTIDWPKILPADCFDCGGRLIRSYRPPLTAIPDDGRRGVEREGLSDLATCTDCRRTYDTTEYGLALRQRAAMAQGWVPVREAAEACRRPQDTIWRWLREGLVAAACDTNRHRVTVWFADVKDLDLAAKRRNHGTKAQPCDSISA